MAYIQDFDVRIEPTERAERTLPDFVYEDFEVNKLKITQRYGAGGSVAELEVLYDDDLDISKITDLARRKHQTEFGFDIKEELTIPPEKQIESQREEILKDYLNTITSDDQQTVNGNNDTRIDAGAKQKVIGSYSGEPKETSGYYRVFTGRPIEVIKKEDGIVKFKFMNNRLRLNKRFLTLEVNEEGNTVYAILDEILTDIGDLKKGPDEDVNTSRFETSPDYDYLLDPYLKDNDFNGAYGLEEPVSLFQVLQGIAIRNAMHLWIDKHNTIRIERKPDTTITIPQLITDLEAGDKQEATETVVKTPYDQTGVGKFSATGASMSKSIEYADWEISSKEGEETVQKSITAYDVNDSKEAANYAKSMYISDELSKNYGKMITIGNPVVSTYDDIVLSHIPDMMPISEGSYSAKQVVHKISAKEGFTTEIQLGRSVGAMRRTLHANIGENERREPPETNEADALLDVNDLLNAQYAKTTSGITEGARKIAEILK